MTTVSSPRSAPSTDHTAVTLSWVSIPPLWQAVLAIALYAAAALAMMWPVPLHPTHLLYGGTGDPFGSMATLHAEVATGQPGFLPGTLHQFNAPDGLPLPWVMGFASLPTSVLLYVLGVLFGPVMAYDVFAFTAFPLSGGAMFLLVRRVTGHAWAAFLAGWALAFFAYAQIKAEGHYELAHSWVIVLAVWRMLEMVQRPSRRNGLLAGLAVVFAMAWTPYFILLAGIAYASLAIGGLMYAARNHRIISQVPAQAIAALLVVLYLVTFYVLSMSVPNDQGSLRTNSVAELNTYSARPLEYIIPNQSNPVFGSLTSHYLQTHLHGSNFAESTLYLGISGLILAAIAVYAAARDKLPPQWRLVTDPGRYGDRRGVGVGASARAGPRTQRPLPVRLHQPHQLYLAGVRTARDGRDDRRGAARWNRHCVAGARPLAAAPDYGNRVRCAGDDRYRLSARHPDDQPHPAAHDRRRREAPPGGDRGRVSARRWRLQLRRDLGPAVGGGHPGPERLPGGNVRGDRALSVSDPAIGQRLRRRRRWCSVRPGPEQRDYCWPAFPRSGYRLLASDPSGSVYAVIATEPRLPRSQLTGSARRSRARRDN